MGVWGSAQAIAFGAGGFVGTVIADGSRVLLGNAGAGYATVFALEAIGFVAAMLVARTIAFPRVARADVAPPQPESSPAVALQTGAAA